MTTHLSRASQQLISSLSSLCSPYGGVLPRSLYPTADEQWWGCVRGPSPALGPVHYIAGQCAVGTETEHRWHLSDEEWPHQSETHTLTVLMYLYPAAGLLAVLLLGLKLLLAWTLLGLNLLLALVSCSPQKGRAPLMFQYPLKPGTGAQITYQVHGVDSP